MNYVVHFGHDVDHDVFYVLSSDILGLHVEAATFEEFVAITREIAHDLVGEPFVGASISFQHEIVLAA